MADAGVTEAVLADLRDEGAELDGLVGGLDGKGWRLPTPAPRWTVAHQIAHLLWTDEQALLAATDEPAFRRGLEHAARAPHTFVDEGAERLAALPAHELLARWRHGRRELADVLAHFDGKLPWYGPPMSAVSMATARLMETWAHGEDVAAALGVRRAPTVRLRHVARLGVRTRDFAFGVHGLEPPAAPFRVELTAPDGGLWTYGPEDAEQRVTGEGADFCRLVTQRLHRADAHLRAEGPQAEQWLTLAQAFAGPPGEGRRPAEGDAA
ncbi:TIGR03084 family metal-binding protein [Streptomyces sp. HNM0574]|uniref:TIGR03084 family metal-binding protein n=1 Tax=Streptomyces sp. HNM0574 TaxID=2714954 RepID=UPI00146AD174|nr:TIGR03084 family metal-binding protein [Streptomyces sp. HNM0574]NLU70938.1 TIGR03084 family protein [Streptomyces sp. HNM0574]